MTNPTKEAQEDVSDPVAALKQNLGDAQDNLDTADDTEQNQIDALENEVNGGSGATSAAQNADDQTQTTAQSNDISASDIPAMPQEDNT